MKQRSLSNPSSTSSLSPTHDRKSTTSYVSPLASSETRSTLQATSINTRSPSIDSAPKPTPPSTPTLEKKKPATQSDSSVFTNDVDERHAEEKKSAWRAPPTKPAQNNEANNIKKPILDKIPKKSTATPTTPKPTNVEAAKAPAKVTKPIKQTPTTPITSKVPQLTLERVDVKSLKTAPGSTDKSTLKSTKLKRTMVMQSDSDTEKKSTKIDVQKPKKTLVSNEVNKSKQPPPPSPVQKALPAKKTPVSKPTVKTSSISARKQSTTDTHTSESDDDEKKLDDSDDDDDDDDETSSDEGEKTKKQLNSKRSKTKNKSKSKSTSDVSNQRDMRQTGTMYDRIKKRPRNEQIRTRYV